MLKYYQKQGIKLSIRILLTHTHTHTHHANFFDYTRDDIEQLKIDYIISNPPYSLKVEVIQRLKELDVPFAMLLGITGVLGSQSFLREFINFPMSLLIPIKRISFILDGEKQASPSFASGFVSYGIFEGIIIKEFKE